MRCALILGVLVAAVAGSGCTRANPDYCDPADANACAAGYRCDPLLNACVADGTPTDGGHEAGGGDAGVDAGGDTAPECSVSSDCLDPDRPICTAHSCEACGGDPECQDRDPTKPACVAGQCAECHSYADCASPVRPVCAADHTCQACTHDLECQGPQPDVSVCVAGACLGASDVLWVSASAGACPGDGSEATPFCALVDAVIAAKTGTRKTIVVRPGTYGLVSLQGSELVGLTVVGLLGGAAVVQGGLSQPAIDIDVGGAVALRRLHLKGAGASSGTTPVLQVASAALTAEELEVDSGGFGVKGTATALLTLLRSRVHHNAAGGIHLSSSSSYAIENNFIWANGTPSSTVGGVYFMQSYGTMRFVNNTVYGNRVSGSLVAGVHCDSSAVITTNNILWENRNGTVVAETDATGGCSITYSVIDVADIANATGAYNHGEDPQFADLISDPIDLHLTAASTSALGQADPTKAPSEDIDGDARPAGGPTDIGADQRSQ